MDTDNFRMRSRRRGMITKEENIIVGAFKGLFLKFGVWFLWLWNATLFLWRKQTRKVWYFYLIDDI